MRSNSIICMLGGAFLLFLAFWGGLGSARGRDPVLSTILVFLFLIVLFAGSCFIPISQQHPHPSRWARRRALIAASPKILCLTFYFAPIFLLTPFQNTLRTRYGWDVLTFTPISIALALAACGIGLLIARRDRRKLGPYCYCRHCGYIIHSGVVRQCSECGRTLQEKPSKLKLSKYCTILIV
jgi:hypothetical protein